MMINRFRNAVTSVITGLPVVNKPPDSDSDYGQLSAPSPPELPLKHSYGRAHFLQLNEDEVQVSADHLCRLIIIPRDVNVLPWCAGYAEAINAGKTKLNEDQARASLLFVRNRRRSSAKTTPEHACHENSDVTQPCGEDTENSFTTQNIEALNSDPLPLTYFAIFDGHAGTGAALMAANHLHDIVVRQLGLVWEPLITRQCSMQDRNGVDENPHSLLYGDKSDQISVDSLVTGALQRAFVLMDSLIEKERVTYQISGGCTALVAIFFLGKLYVANAGDSRAVICRGEEVTQLSTDFTPQSERTRIEHLACLKPELLKGEFCRLEFQRRVTRKDIGQQILYRDAWMTGWSSKIITEKDTRFPLIYGEGKRTRMLATIGVTRGFGDHTLCVYDTDIAIKPFLLSVPEVKVYDLNSYNVSENDVLIMGSDGLWDVTSNEKAVSIVRASLARLAADNPVRYTSAAHDLVMHARGMLLEGNWRIPSNGDVETASSSLSASTDDITAFVIPVHQYKAECARSVDSSPSSSVEIINADGGDEDSTNEV